MKKINFKKIISKKKNSSQPKLIWQANHSRYEIEIKKIRLSKEGPSKKDQNSKIFKSKTNNNQKNEN